MTKQRPFPGIWILLTLMLLVSNAGFAASTNASEKISSREVKFLSGVQYGKASGETLLMDICLPPGNFPRPRPAILLVHGGGWQGGSRNTSHLITAGKTLAAAGFATFSIDYRLVRPAGSGPAKNVFPAALDDCQRAVRWIRHHAAKYEIGPKRIGALGESAGGHLVSLLGTTDTRDNSDKELAAYSSRVSAVVNLYGPTDLTRDFAKLKPNGATAQAIVDLFVGKGNRENQRAASPVLHLNEKTAAFLIFHGAEDPLVPVELSRDFAEALKKNGREVTYIEFPNEGHVISKPENHLTFQQKTFEFFQRTLK